MGDGAGDLMSCEPVTSSTLLLRITAGDRASELADDRVDELADDRLGDPSGCVGVAKSCGTPL